MTVAAAELTAGSTPTADSTLADERAVADARWATRFVPGLAALAAAGALFRLVFVLIARDDYYVWGDALFYHGSANLVADGIGWLNPLDYEAGLHAEAADHPPLYIAYLALWSWLGVTSPLGHILVSCALGVTTIVVLGLAGRRIAGPRVGLVAAALALVYPNVWSHDTMILSETVAILTVALFTLTVYRFRDQPSFALAGVCGVLLGLMAMSRAELLLLSLIVIVPVMLGRTLVPLARRVAWIAVAAAAAVATLAPWVLHNLSRFEEPVYLSAGFEITLSTATCDLTYYGEFTGYWNMQCPIAVLDEKGLTRANSDQSERSEVLLDETLSYISENRGRVPAVVAARVGRIAGLYRPLQQARLDVFPEGRDKWIAYSGAAMWYPLAGLAIAGAVILRRRRIPIYPLVAPFAVVLVVVVTTFATNRYRASAEGSLCLLAAVAVVALSDAVGRVRATPDATVPEQRLPTTATLAGSS
ncbi:MAG TPA: glycosyltransferase family 39 protein [Acidimicrobiales bacterium]|nr:glycosyltransferase family 39 protein [Acidimicrobiales bacterium]